MKKQKRTKDERTAMILSLWDEGYDVDEIAENVGLARDTVYKRLHYFGVFDKKISLDWLYQSGVGDAWDRTCRGIREACGA